jgi:hypothetical protein
MGYTDFGMCSGFTSDIFVLLILSSISVIFLSVLVTMLGKMMNNRRMEMWSSNMVYDVITTLIIAGLFITLFAAFSSNELGSAWALSLTTVSGGSSPSFSSSACVFGNAMSYLAETTRYTLNVANLAIWANANMEVLTSTTKTEPTIGYGFAYYNSNLVGQPMYPDISRVRDMISGVMNMAIMVAITANTAQLFLLKMVLSPILLSLLAFAMVLRPIPMFKYFSNSIISLMISFMLVFPLVVTLEGMVFPNPNINTMYGSATSFDEAAKKSNVQMVSDSFGQLLLQALINNLADKWTVWVDTNGGLAVHSGSDLFISTSALMKGAYNAFLRSSFILAINVISIVAGTKAIATLMDEEESLMEMFIKVV